MDGPPAVSFNLQKPGRVLQVVLGALTIVGIGGALFIRWVPAVASIFGALVCQLDLAVRQPWRLITSGLVTSPEQWTHLLFSLVGLYFLGAPLERRWGGWRFARFLVLAVVMGNLLTLGADEWIPGASPSRFHPELVYGPSAAISAVAVAWSREYPDSVVNFFFFLPIRGGTLLWITLGFCVLDLVYPSAMPEGVLAPFGGVATGLLFGGSPSVMRRAWLAIRLALLRRKSRVHMPDVVEPRPPRRSRQGGPPLRVVSGGLDEVLKKRTPPKDKRYLN